MKFSEFQKYQPKQVQNVVGFVCEDDFLVEESRPIWQRIFGGTWVFEKLPVKDFEEIPAGRLMDAALTPSLFTQNRIIIVTTSDKLRKARIEDLEALQKIPNSSLKVVLAAGKPLDALPKGFPIIAIDELTPGEVARWILDRYKLAPEIARYMVDNIGTELYQLHTEIEKLQTYVGGVRPVETRDIDVLILRSEQFGPYELQDAIMARDYKKAVQVTVAMLDEGMEPLLLLSRIVRVWRQLFVGKSLVGKHGAREVAAAAGAPFSKAAEFTAACRKFEWKQLAGGFRLLLNADRAFKTSTPNPEGYFDVMLWKLIG